MSVQPDTVGSRQCERFSRPCTPAHLSQQAQAGRLRSIHSPEHLKGQKVTLRIAEMTIEEVYRPGGGSTRLTAAICTALRFEQTKKWLPVNIMNPAVNYRSG